MPFDFEIGEDMVIDDIVIGRLPIAQEHDKIAPNLVHMRPSPRTPRQGLRPPPMLRGAGFTEYTSITRSIGRGIQNAAAAAAAYEPYLGRTTNPSDRARYGRNEP